MREEAYIYKDFQGWTKYGWKVPDPSKTQDLVNKITQMLKEENLKIWFVCPETKISEKVFGTIVELLVKESIKEPIDGLGLGCKWEKLNWNRLTKVIDKLFNIPEIKAVTIRTHDDCWWCVYKKSL